MLEPLCNQTINLETDAKRDWSQQCKVQKAGGLDPSPLSFCQKQKGTGPTPHLPPPHPQINCNALQLYESSGFPCQMVIHSLSSILTCSIWGSLHVCIFNVIVLLLAISHARASFSDPGKLQLVNINPQKLIYTVT